MTRFGLALALFICVIVALTVPPAFAKIAEKLEGYGVTAASDHKGFHGETNSEGSAQ